MLLHLLLLLLLPCPGMDGSPWIAWVLLVERDDNEAHNTEHGRVTSKTTEHKTRDDRHGEQDNRAQTQRTASTKRRDENGWEQHNGAQKKRNESCRAQSGSTKKRDKSAASKRKMARLTQWDYQGENVSKKSNALHGS